MIIVLKNGDTVEADDKWYKVIKAGRPIEDTEGCVIPYHMIDTVLDDEEIYARVDFAITDVSIIG